MELSSESTSLLFSFATQVAIFMAARIWVLSNLSFMSLELIQVIFVIVFRAIINSMVSLFSH
jgi:hypothetical protein